MEGATHTGSIPDMSNVKGVTNRKVKKKKKKKTVVKRYKDFVKESSHLYFLQPNGKWKKGGDGRSPGKTYKQLCDMGKKNLIE